MKVHLHAITIIVGNIKRSISFYRLLGLNIPDATGEETHIDCTWEGETYICLVPESTVTKHHPDWKRTEINNTVSLHFKCPDKGDVDIMYTMLVNEEYVSSMQPYNTPWGERYAQILDPDGNTVALFAPL